MLRFNFPFITLQKQTAKIAEQFNSPDQKGRRFFEVINFRVYDASDIWNSNSFPSLVLAASKHWPWFYGF